MSEGIQHYGPNGQVLRFENWDGLYPVNRFQSLLLATNAHTEAMIYAAERQQPLTELKAIEICCGGGAAAIVLKAAGFGYVEATDINVRALDMCRNNAQLNHLLLDKVYQRDMLATSSESCDRYDLIVCNPPCGRTALCKPDSSDDMITAVNGGVEGVDFVLPLIDAAPNLLAVGGRLIFVLTSTMAFELVVKKLCEIFGQQWRVSYHTPVAQQFGRGTSATAETLRNLGHDGKILVWVGEDGWIWRLSWIVVATNDTTPTQAGKLSFWPVADDVKEPEFLQAVRRFQPLMKQ